MKAAPFLLRNLITAPDLPVTYVLNPRAGSTAIRLTLIRALDGDAEVERVFCPPFTRFRGRGRRGAREALAKPTFTAVRNPYDRALSCYRSKVAGGGRKIASKLALPPEPTFEEYMVAVAASPTSDRHWAPQVLNLAGTEPRIFKLEEPGLSDYLLETLGRPLEDITGMYSAKSLAEHLTGRSADLIREVYAEDFEAFNYPS